MFPRYLNNDFLFDKAEHFELASETARVALAPKFFLFSLPSRSNKALSNASKPARERITTFTINWNIVAWPGKAWACRVFPELSAEEAQYSLAEAIFAASRVNNANPHEMWKKHNENLKQKYGDIFWQNVQAYIYSDISEDVTFYESANKFIKKASKMGYQIYFLYYHLTFLHMRSIHL